MDKIKPCPFCGAVARLLVIDGVKVMCTKCDCQTKTHDDMNPFVGLDNWRDGKHIAVVEAIEEWNKRIGEQDDQKRS